MRSAERDVIQTVTSEGQMSIDQKILKDEDVDRIISAARQIHAKCPADTNGEKSPMANLAIQYSMIEEGREFQTNMLLQQKEIVRGTWWLVGAALFASAISIIAVLISLVMLHSTMTK